MADVEIKFGGDASPMQAAVDQMAAQLKSLQTQVATLNQNMGTASGQLRSFTGAISSLRSAAGNSGLSTLSEEGTRAAASIGHVSERSSGLAKELVSVGSKIVGENFPQLAGVADTVAEHWEMLGEVFSNPVTAGIAVAGAAIVYLGAKAQEADAEQAKIANSLMWTSHAAGLTESGFDDLANTVSDSTGATKSHVDDVLVSLNNFGMLGGKELGDLGVDVVKLEQITGQSSDKIVSDLQGAIRDPTGWLQEYSQETGKVTLKEYEHVEALEKQRGKAEAAKEVFRLLTQNLKDQKPQVDALSSAVQSLSKMWDDATTAVSKYLGLSGQTKQERLNELTDDLHHGGGGGFRGAFKGFGKGFGASMGSGNPFEMLAGGFVGAFEGSQGRPLQQIRGEITGLRQDINQANRQAKHDQETGNRNRQQVAQHVAQGGNGGGGGGGNTPLRSGGPSRQGGGASASSKDETGLRQREMEQKDYFADYTQQEQQFWNQKLAHAKKGTAEYNEILTRAYEANKKAAEDTYQAQVQRLDDEFEQAKGDSQKQRHLAEQERDYKLGVFKNNLKEQEAARREYEKRIRQIEQQEVADHLRQIDQKTQYDVEGLKRAEEAQRHHEDAMIQLIDRQESNGQISMQRGERERLAIIQRENQEEVAAINKRYDAFIQNKQQELQDERLAGDQRKQIQTDIANFILARDNELSASIQAGILRREDAERASAQRIEDMWRQRWSTIASSFTASVRGMIQGTMNLRSALSNVFNGILGVFEQMTSKMVENWLVAHVKIGQSAKASAEMQKVASLDSGMTAGKVSADSAKAAINNDSLTAFSGAYQAIAKIPYVGPFLAPAVAMAAEMAVAGLAGNIMGGSHYGGLDAVPSDGWIAELHRNETVLPASLAVPLRAALTGGGPGLGGGDTHVHYHDHSGRLTPDQIRANKGAFVKMLKEAHREFALNPRFAPA